MHIVLVVFEWQHLCAPLFQYNLFRIRTVSAKHCHVTATSCVRCSSCCRVLYAGNISSRMQKECTEAYNTCVFSHVSGHKQLQVSDTLCYWPQDECCSWGHETPYTWCDPAPTVSKHTMGNQNCGRCRYGLSNRHHEGKWSGVMWGQWSGVM